MTTPLPMLKGEEREKAIQRQRDLDEQCDRLREEVKNTRCARCRRDVQVVWAATEWKKGCECPDGPVIVSKPRREAERLSKMVESSLIKRPEVMPLTLSDVRTFLSPHATEKEGYVFLRFCQAQGLNPFTHEVYLVKYDERATAAIVVGIDTFLKRASRRSNYMGFAAGVVVQDKDGKITDQERSIVYPGENLIGGWCRVDRKDMTPTKVAVSFQEYNRNHSTWKQMPATMIVKVATKQAHQKAFPEDMPVVVSEEQENRIEVIIDAEATGEPSHLQPAHAPQEPARAPVAAETAQTTAQAATDPATAFSEQVTAWFGKNAPAMVRQGLGMTLPEWLKQGHTFEEARQRLEPARKGND